MSIDWDWVRESSGCHRHDGIVDALKQLHDRLERLERIPCAGSREPVDNRSRCSVCGSLVPFQRRYGAVYDNYDFPMRHTIGGEVIE